MRRVGEEGEAAGEDARDDLDDRVACGQGKCEPERTGAPRANVVLVVVPHAPGCTGSALVAAPGSGHHPGMRAKIVAVVAVVAISASAVVVAVASTSANGLPSYTDGYAKWPKINRKPITKCGPPCAHGGVKNVYASKRKVRSKYPNGTVVVKSIVESGTRYVGKVAVMRKVRGRWQYVEYTRSSAAARYTVLEQGRFCQNCHAQAKANDYVFTNR